MNRWLLIPMVWWLNWLLLQLQDLLLQRFPLLSQRDLTPRICAGALLALPKCGPRTMAKLLEINIQNWPFCTSSNSQLGETQPSYIQGPPPYRRWIGRRVQLCLSLDAEFKLVWSCLIIISWKSIDDVSLHGLVWSSSHRFLHHLFADDLQYRSTSQKWWFANC